MTSPHPRRPRQTGIALPAVIFLMVIVGLMLSAGLLMLTQSQHGQSLQLQAARALAAAKSGTEWGLWKVSDVGGVLGLAPDELPECFAPQSLKLHAPLADLSVQVSCSREPAVGTLDEGGLKLASYRIVALASSGDAAGNEYVQRQFEARHTVCRNPGGSAPRYAC